MPETTPLIKAALNLRVGAGFDVYFITVKEIGEVLGVSESKSYGIVRDLNKELADKGYMVIPGRVSRKYFEERFYGGENETEVKEVQHAGE